MSTAAPQVSILLVAHGARDWTLRALAAVAEHTPRPHEVILVDNASPDGTAALVRAAHPEVVLVENDANVGFGPANNQAAALARAPVLVLLNTDALVGPGWLEPLLDALARADVGAAVPALVHLDGSLQEAGALLGADGTVVSHGDGGDPDDAAYAFPRLVDFGAAACMAVRAGLFSQLGGFDDDYAPAYYEDADLCLRLAQAGWATAYVPASRVVHARYGSSTGERARELSERNRARFAARWADPLAVHPPSLADPSPATLLAARDALADGRVLVLGADCDREAVAALLGALLDVRPRARVTLLVPGGLAAWGDWTARGVEVAEPGADGTAAWLDERRWHVDLVLVAGADAPATALADTQPQALVVRELPSAAALPGVLADAGLA